MQSVLNGMTGVAIGGVVTVGIAVVSWLALSEWFFWRKCEKWCAKRGLKCVRVETKDGGYGYVAHDPVRVLWFQIPGDFGDLDEGRRIGARLMEFDWKGTDKVAVEKDGTTIPLDFVKKGNGDKK